MLLLCAFSGLAFAGGTSASPVLTYSTYLRDRFTAMAIATDSSGNIYLAGNANADPATAQRVVLVVKLNPQATEYLYARLLGGSVNDYANAIAVDSAGNAYIAGSTASPDFPVASGGKLGTAATGQSDQRSFLLKLDPAGNLVFSDLLGGSAASAAQAVAVDAAGEVLVSGTVSAASGPAFPSTAGAYSVATTASRPYLLKLDPTGTKAIFSATGIGGSAMALDSSGNIYVAGSTDLTDYPTTPGVYQTTFPVVSACTGFVFCMPVVQGINQYVTKVDPTGSRLIYSTAVAGTGNVLNGGLAVDGSGNVYLTGYTPSGYPFTVTPPAIPAGAFTSALPFLSKLDPAGQKLLFSVPVGGAGVQVDATGAVYVGGGIGVPGYPVKASLPALASVPAPCLPNGLTIYTSAYVAQVDASSGNVLGSQFIGGSELTPSAVALSGSVLWLAGSTNLPDVPFTAGALTIPYFEPGIFPGAYLGAVDFSQPQPPAGTPQIGCILDAATWAPVGPVARYQLLTIFGAGLGPAQGVSGGTDYSTTTLAGVGVNVSGNSAPLLYASATQINFAVPQVQPISQSGAVIEISSASLTSVARQLPFTDASPGLFLNLAQTYQANSMGFIALALNQDGSLNSAANPAPRGSTVSVFVNGIIPSPQISPYSLYGGNGWSIVGTAQPNPFVLRVDLRVPTTLVNDFSCPPGTPCTAAITLQAVSGISAGQAVSSDALAFGGYVYVSGIQ
jgi:uncharacterized protein (TIGR03437 family)